MSQIRSPIVVTIGNQKGGVGKTTTVVNLADALGRLGYTVLVLDADPQSNTTSILLTQPELREKRNLVQVLTSSPGEGFFSASACPTENPNVKIIPNYIDCLLWEQKAMNTIDVALGFHRIFKIDQPLREKYHFILIDTPPNLGAMVNNALMISDYVLCPIPIPDQFALDGFSTFLGLIARIRQQNEKLSLLGVLLTKYDARATTYKRNKDLIEEFFVAHKLRIFHTIIRINVDLDRAHQKRKTIFALDKSKAGAIDYMTLASEITEFLHVEL